MIMIRQEQTQWNRKGCSFAAQRRSLYRLDSAEIGAAVQQQRQRFGQEKYTASCQPTVTKKRKRIMDQLSACQVVIVVGFGSSLPAVGCNSGLQGVGGVAN